MFVVDAGRTMLLGPASRLSAADQPLLDGRTQWHVLSASIMQPMVGIAQGGTGSMLQLCADDNIGVTADGERWSSDDATQPSSRRVQASPTVPRQASLPMVGPAMVAGAMIGHRRERDARRPRLLFNFL